MGKFGKNSQRDEVRGGVTKKNENIWGKFPKQTKIPNFNLGILKTQGGGLNFSKMSES